MTKKLLAIDRHKNLNAFTQRADAITWDTWRNKSKLLFFETNTPDQVFNEINQNILFPTSAIFSTSCISKSGSLAEASLIGREGFVGLWSINDSASSQIFANVQIAGYALSIPKRFLRNAFLNSSWFRLALLDYASMSIKYVTQTCYCYRHHSVDQQVVKFLLLLATRTQAIDLAISHYRIAYALGVRREGVSAALKRLQILRLIKQSRCHILLYDINGLEAETCSCYRILLEYLGYTDSERTV